MANMASQSNTSPKASLPRGTKNLGFSVGKGLPFWKKPYNRECSLTTRISQSTWRSVQHRGQGHISSDLSHIGYRSLFSLFES